MKAVERLNIKEIDKKIANATLFDSGIKLIKSKLIYVFSHNDKDYNLYLNNNNIFINERIINENNEKNYITERILEIDLINMEYKVTSRYHDKHLSTHDIKFYNSKGNELSYFIKDNGEFILEAEDLGIREGGLGTYSKKQISIEFTSQMQQREFRG